MAIFSKNKKNKKEPRNSSLPQGAPGSQPKSSLENMSASQSPRQVSAASTSSGSPYDKMPIGVPPETSLAGENKASPTGLQQQSQLHQSNRPLSPSLNSARSPTGNQSPQLGFRGPLSPPVQMTGAGMNGQQQLPQGRGLQQAHPPSHPSNPAAAAARQQQQTPSQYPWSQQSVQNASPFPRYGHAANAIAARDGEVFVMGGLKGSNVFGDLWVVETDTLTGYLLDTEGCPSPRVGHASLTLGNAFIVFGGDTKIEETDDLDDNLYLLNTTTLKWTVANPSGPRPSGRYGHSISTIGSKVFVFGGQLDDYFFDDLVCYDLTTLRSANSQWQLIHPSSPSPPPRTNHTVITFQDKLYLFGGTDGKLWYSDTWCYDPQENAWTLLECTGFIPAPCEGHSATIVGEIMYVFGGRSSQGQDLGTLSALKLTTRKWFTFQNLGPGPSPRSGHSMTAFAGHKILVMGGESPGMRSVEEENEEKNNTVYILDTSRINYPLDNPAQVQSPQQQQVSPTGQQQVPAYNDEKREVDPNTELGHATEQRVRSPHGNYSPTNSNGRQSPAINNGVTGAAAATAAAGGVAGLVAAANLNDEKVADPSLGQPTIDEKLDDNYGSGGHLRSPSGASELTPGVGYERVNVTGNDGDGHSITDYESVENDDAAAAAKISPGRGTPDISKIPGAWMGTPKSQEAALANATDSTAAGSSSSPLQSDITAREVSGSSPPTNLDTTTESFGGLEKSTISPDSVDDQSTPRASITEEGFRAAGVNGHAAHQNGAALNIPRSRGLDDELDEDDDYEAVNYPPPPPNDVNEALERLKASNTWYESELAAAKHQGYIPQSRPPVDVLKLRRVSQRLTHDTSASLQERDILIAALGELKEELQNVQENVQRQAQKASQRISEAEVARDEAMQQLQSIQAGGAGDAPARIAQLQAQLDARSINDDGSVEALKGEKIAIEKELRNQTDELVQLRHELSVLKAEHESLSGKYQGLESTTGEHVAALGAASAAVLAAQNLAKEHARQVDEHKSSRAVLEEQVRTLQSQLAEQQTRGDGLSRELDDHKQLLAHANEQSEKSVTAMNSGIGNIVAIWGASKALGGRQRSLEGDEDDEDEDPRLAHLQQRMDEVSELHKTHKEAADKASLELSQALEQISLLKQQLASVHESKSSAVEEHESTKAELEQHKRELEELNLQHSQTANSATERTQELEQRLETELAAAKAERQKSDDAHKAQYAELENEYERSMQYFTSTETALTKTREDLSRQKDINEKLQKELDELKLSAQEAGDVSGERVASPSGTSSKFANRQFDLQLRDLKAQIIILQEERDEVRENLLQVKKKQINMTQDLDDSQAEIERLTQENSRLSSQLDATGNGSTFTDPESGQTLDHYDAELEQLQNERRQIH